MTTTLEQLLLKSPVLVVLAGMPGLGKSYLARTLARATGAVVVDLDACWSDVGWCASAEVRQIKTYNMAARRTRKALQVAGRVIVDSCALSADYRRRILGWPQTPVPAHCIYFEPDGPLTEQRRPHLAPETIQRFEASWATPSEAEGFVSVHRSTSGGAF